MSHFPREKTACKTVTGEFSLEELGMASIVSDPADPKIKASVPEYAGVKLSSLSIAQIQEKNGLEVAAFRHFNMI